MSILRRVNERKLMRLNFIANQKNKVIFECIQLELFTSLREHVLNVGSNCIYYLTQSVISKYFTVPWKKLFYLRVND